MKLSLRISAMFIAALSVIFMGCLHEDENSSLTSRLSAAEAELSTTKTELSTVRGELSSVQGDLSSVQGDLSDAQNALSECQDKGLGALKVVNDTNSSIHYLYISPEGDNSWGPDLTEEVGTILEAGWPNVKYFPLEPGTYDIRVVFADGDELESVRTISAGEVTTLRYFIR